MAAAIAAQELQLSAESLSPMELSRTGDYADDGAGLSQETLILGNKKLVCATLSRSFFVEHNGRTGKMTRVLFVCPYVVKLDSNSPAWQHAKDANEVFRVVDVCRGGLDSMEGLIIALAEQKGMLYKRIVNVKVTLVDERQNPLYKCLHVSLCCIKEDGSMTETMIGVLRLNKEKKRMDLRPAGIPQFICGSCFYLWGSMIRGSGLSNILLHYPPNRADEVDIRNVIYPVYGMVRILDHRSVATRTEYSVEWTAESILKGKSLQDHRFAPTWQKEEPDKKTMIRLYNQGFVGGGRATVDIAIGTLLLLMQRMKQHNVYNQESKTARSGLDTQTKVDAALRKLEKRVTGATDAINEMRALRSVNTLDVTSLMRKVRVSGTLRHDGDPEGYDDGNDDGLEGITFSELRLGRVMAVNELSQQVHDKAAQGDEAAQKTAKLNYQLSIMLRKDLFVSCNSKVYEAFVVPFMDRDYDQVQVQQASGSTYVEYEVRYPLRGEGLRYKRSVPGGRGGGGGGSEETYLMTDIVCRVKPEKHTVALYYKSVRHEAVVAALPLLQIASELTPLQLKLIATKVLHSKLHFFEQEQAAPGGRIFPSNSLHAKSVRAFENYVTKKHEEFFNPTTNEWWTDMHTFDNEDPTAREIKKHGEMSRQNVYKLIGNDVHLELTGDGDGNPFDWIDAKPAYVNVFHENCEAAVEDYLKRRFLDAAAANVKDDIKSLCHELEVYYPYSLFGSRPVDHASAHDSGVYYADDGTEQHHRLLRVFIDAVKTVRTKKTNELKVVVIEYKCIMGNNTSSKLVNKTVTDNRTRKQVLAGATLFHMCTGIRPDYVMTVHCTRFKEGQTQCVELLKEDVAFATSSSKNPKMSRMVTFESEFAAMEKSWIEDNLNEFWKELCEKTDSTHLGSFTADAIKFKNEIESVTFTKVLAAAFKVTRVGIGDGSFLRIVKPQAKIWNRARCAKGPGAYVQCQEYGYDRDVFANRGRFLEALCGNPLGVKIDTSNGNETWPGVVYCDDNYVLPSLYQVLALRPSPDEYWLFDEVKRSGDDGPLKPVEERSLRWCLPRMRICEFANQYDHVNLLTSESFSVGGAGGGLPYLQVVKKNSGRSSKPLLMQILPLNDQETLELADEAVREFCKGDNGTEVATVNVSELLDPSNDQEPMRLYRTRAAKPTTQRGTEAEDGKKYCYFFLLFHGVNAAKGNAANRVTLATPKVIDLSRSGAAGSRGPVPAAAVGAMGAPAMFDLWGGLDGDAAAPPAAVESAAWMHRQRRELNDQVHKVANELMQRIIAYCDVHHKRRARDERVTVKDVWNCMLLYYNVRDSFHGNNGKGDGKGRTLEFLFRPDLHYAEDGQAIGHYYTESNSYVNSSHEVLHESDDGQTKDDSRKRLLQICVRTLHRLVNQSVVSSVVPLRITRPEAIFEHFGTANAATKAKIFAAIRGVHLPLAVASDHQDYKDIYQDHKSECLAFDDSFRRVLRGRGRGGGAAGGALPVMSDRPFVNGEKEALPDVVNPQVKRATWCFKDEATQAAVDSSRINNFVRPGHNGKDRYAPGHVLDMFCHDSGRGNWSAAAYSKALTPVSERGGLVPVRLAAMELLDHFEATIATVLAHRRTADKSEALIETLKVIFAQENIVYIV